MENESRNRPLKRQVLALTCSMMVGMTIYESTKQFVDPHITIWQSHIVTIMFSSTCAAFISFFFLRKLHEKNHENIRLQKELEIALADIQPLTGLLPICASCKKYRDDKGYWKQIELYIKEHVNVDLTHGICPDCKEKQYSEFIKQKKYADN